MQLVPCARDLYFILHDILYLDYKLIPQLYKDNQCLQWETDEYHEVLYILSTLYFDETERNEMNMEKLITMGIKQNKSLKFFNDTNIFEHISKLIASFSINQKFQFDKDILDSQYSKQLTFNHQLNEVYFDNAWNDFINVINDKNLLTEDCNGEYRIDTFVLGRNSEMWIGIIDKSIYGEVDYVEDREKSIFYYYWSSIQAFGTADYKKLNESLFRYDEYDWVSFVVNIKKNSITFYKNQQKVIEIDKLFDGDDFRYNIVVDRKHDGVFVEKVFF